MVFASLCAFLENGVGLRLRVVDQVLGVEFGVVHERLGLRLRFRARGGRVLLGTFEQLGARLLGGGEHLLGVGAQRGKRVVGVRLAVLLLLQLRLQLQHRVVACLHLFAQTVDAVLCRQHRLVHALLVVAAQNYRETIHHVQTFPIAECKRIYNCTLMRRSAENAQTSAKITLSVCFADYPTDMRQSAGEGADYAMSVFTPIGLT